MSGRVPDKINLYVGKECVERHISFDLADQKLIELIKAHGSGSIRRNRILPHQPGTRQPVDAGADLDHGFIL